MRIAMISTPFLAVPPPDYGGTELVVHELVEGLVERGHQVTLFATGDSRTSAELRSLFLGPEWPPTELTDLNHVSWAFARIAEGDYDLVHAHTSAALAMSRLLPDLPLVYTLHHCRVEALSEFYCHFPDAQYVAVSADQQRREIPLPRCTVIHHGLDPSPYAWTERPADYVCFVGRFSRGKGPHTAIDAAARAGLPILIAGVTHAPDQTFARAELEPRLRLPHVTYLGPVGPAEKVPLLRDARALLAPIDWDEPFGLILIEAMLSGCPAVAFSRGSVPELVEPGITGFVVNNLEEMVAVIRPGGPLDGFDRRRCRARALQRFSRRRLVLDYERVYAIAAGAPGRRRRLPTTAA
jgi:glycosyltransferase involved in cell wall biosynthesis